MAFKINKVSELNISSHSLYFCDTMVWIAALKHYGIGNIESREKEYIRFIEKIVEYSIESNEGKPQIAMTSMLLSEIINTYMRKVAMKTYFGDKFHGGLNFKSSYRDNPEADYRKQLNNIITDLKCFEDYIVFIDDSFIELKPFDMLDNLTDTIDYNDYYYYCILKKHNIPIITDDSDILFEDILIFTNHNKLLQKVKK